MLPRVLFQVLHYLHCARLLLIIPGLVTKLKAKPSETIVRGPVLGICRNGTYDFG
jgi:hypothetical protein